MDEKNQGPLAFMEAILRDHDVRTLKRVDGSTVLHCDMCTEAFPCDTWKLAHETAREQADAMLSLWFGIDWPEPAYEF